jgi:hypothetical protein
VTSPNQAGTSGSTGDVGESEFAVTAAWSGRTDARILPQSNAFQRQTHGRHAACFVGSAGVLIEPDDRYLCIVPAISGRTKVAMLPFEGDAVLSLVLSKVVMLAADDKITDPTIVQQIQRRQ